MNEANLGHRISEGVSRFLHRDSVSRTAITLYTVTFFAASFFGITGWRPYVPMAVFALVPIVAGPRIYRVAGAIALLIAVEAGRLEFQQEQRYELQAQLFSSPAPQPK